MPTEVRCVIARCDRAPQPPPRWRARAQVHAGAWRHPATNWAGLQGGRPHGALSRSFVSTAYQMLGRLRAGQRTSNAGSSPQHSTGIVCATEVLPGRRVACLVVVVWRAARGVCQSVERGRGRRTPAHRVCQPASQTHALCCDAGPCCERLCGAQPWSEIGLLPSTFIHLVQRLQVRGKALGDASRAHGGREPRTAMPVVAHRGRQVTAAVRRHAAGGPVGGPSPRHAWAGSGVRMARV